MHQGPPTQNQPQAPTPQEQFQPNQMIGSQIFPVTRRKQFLKKLLNFFM